MMKLLHLGLCATGHPYNDLQEQLSQHFIYDEVYTGNVNFKEVALEKFRKFQPDIVFMQIQSPGVVDAEFIKKFSGALVINWTGDVRFPIPQWYIDIAPYCVTMFTNMNDVHSLSHMGYNADYLQIGYDPNIYNPDIPEIIKHDVVFLANNYGDAFPLSDYRVKIVNALRDEFGEKFALYGNGWEHCNGNVNGSQYLEAAVYRSSKIAISCSHFNYERYFSDRLLRAMGTGVMVLSHHYEGVREDFDASILPTFVDVDDMVSQVKWYLENDHERKTTANGGWLYVSSNFTFKHMIENLQTLVQKWI